MATPATTQVRNYFKLELLVSRAQTLLRQLFKKRYSIFYPGNIWDDTPTCGTNYLNNVVKVHKTIQVSPVLTASFSHGNTNEWDITTLLGILLYDKRPTTLDQQQLQQLDEEDKLLKQLRELRNTITHHSSKSIDDTQFDQYWTDLTTILVALGEVDTELDKLKDDSVFDDHSQSINPINVEEAKRLNSLGTQAHNDGKYKDAITFFTKATVLSGVTDHDRAIFYSNMSSSRLALYEQKSGAYNIFEMDDPSDQQYRALQDAKKARNLWSIWWKGHYRVGKAYASMNEHEKAINSFERALALEPSKIEIQKALDESRDVYNRHSQRDYLNPRAKPTRVSEESKKHEETPDVDSQSAWMNLDLLEVEYPSGADVMRGHKYLRGDSDVKQNYEQAAKYFAKAANQENAEGLYNLAWLTDRGLGVKKDRNLARQLYEQAAKQSPQHPVFSGSRNIGVAEAEHALGRQYEEGNGIHKNLEKAAHWYQRAVDHGNVQSANNLAIIYENGIGVERNVDKAQQLYELLAKKDDPNAMLRLAELLLEKNDLEMAKIWYDRACKTENVISQTKRDTFEKNLQEKQRLEDQCSADVPKTSNATERLLNSLRAEKSVYKQKDQRHTYDYNMLNDYANRGSLTAKRMADALEHFLEAFYILKENDILTEEQERIFVQELSQCYRMEYIVAQFPSIEICQKADEIIDSVIRRCITQFNDTSSQLDEDARICYAVLHMDSYKSITKFLDLCKQKYPKSIYFFEFSTIVNCVMERYETTLYDANNGLQIDPNYTELLYYKAVALRLIGKDMNEAIKTYQTFLSMAPKDHRKVPESYYAIANCYFEQDAKEGTLDIIKKNYKQGWEAEKLQLPYFLPYESNTKKFLEPIIGPTTLSSTEEIPVVVNRKFHLSNSHRIEVISQHREREGRALEVMNNAKGHHSSFTQKPRIQQPTAKSLIGLKSISLKKMDPTKEHAYTGYVLAVTIIEETYSWTPFIQLIIEDENLDCERMCIYGFPEDHGKYLTSQVYTIGSKMHIINPNLRIDANDKKPLIRIDNYSSIIMQNESERVVNMCRCCGEANAQHVCSKCKRARYCSKECQSIDLQTYKHNLICKK